MITVDIAADLNDEDETVMEPSGTIVHLRVLPGTIEDYEALVRRAGIPA